MLIIVLLFLFVLLVVFYLYKNCYNDHWKRRNVVQHGEIMTNFVFGDRSLAEIFKDIYNKYPTEPYVGTFAGMKKGLILRDLRNIQVVLTHEFESFHSRGILKNDNDVLADNILSITDYNRWKLIRQKVSPIFTSAKLKNMCYIIEKCASDFVEMVKENKKMRDKPFNAMYTYTTASIGASVFGFNTNMKSSMDSPFLDMAWKTTKPSFLADIQFFVTNVSPTLFKLFNFKFFEGHEDFFVGVVKKVLKIRRNETKAIHDFIDLCVELQRNGTMRDPSTGYEMEPTDEVMAAQAFFFFLAGADTSAITMHFLLLELSSNPHVLRKLHQEIDAAFHKCQGKITFEIMESLQYLDMVLNETMRKYPPIGILQRECAKSTVLPVGNLKIEEGVIISVPVLAIHRDPKYFPDPEKFDPERFALDNLANQVKFGFIPFGEGKRICIGARYARLQIKAGLIFLLRSFTLKEQNYKPKKFEKSTFAVKDSRSRYDLILRDLEF